MVATTTLGESRLPKRLRVEYFWKLGMVTPLGLVIITIVLGALIYRRDDLLLQLATGCIVLQAGSVNSTTGYISVGVMPYYFCIVVLGIIWGSRALRRACIGEKNICLLDAYTFLFVLFILLGAILLPRLFSGTPVYAPADGIDDSVSYQRPLAMGGSNFSQAGYFLLNVIFLYVVFAETQTSIAVRRLVALLKIAGCAVLVISIWQRAAKFGMPIFPDELIRNNFSFSLQLESDIRVCGTFSESSLCGAFLAAIGCAWYAELASSARPLRAILIWLTFLLGVINTLGTTGLLIYPLVSAAASTLVFRKLSRSERTRLFVYGGLIALSFLIAVTIVVSSNEELQNLASLNLFNKVETSSYENRSASNNYALRLFEITYGIGLGIGSNRPSSLLLYLLSNLGVIGTITILFFVGRLMWGALTTLLGGTRGFDSGIFLLTGFSTLLLAQIISIPDMSFPPTIVFGAILMAWCEVTRENQDMGVATR